MHLAYQTSLKQHFQLTLGNTDMLYRRCSQVTDDDIASAAAHIQQQLADIDQLQAFCSQWEPMQKHIQRVHQVDITGTGF